MVLYSLLAVPIFALLIVSYKLSARGEAKLLWIQYSRGVLSFIPAYLIFLLIRGSVPLTYSYGGIFFHYFFYDALFFSLLGSLFYILIRSLSSRSGRGSVSESFMFLAGYFTFASVLEVVRNFPYYNPYLLFLHPTVRLALISALAILLARFYATEGWVRWVYLVVGLVFVSVSAFVPFLFVVHLGYAAIIVAVVLFLAALSPYILMTL